MAKNDLLNALSVFNLDLIPDEWSEWVWDREFMDVNDRPLPDEYVLYLEDTDIASCMQDASTAIKEWMSSKNEDNQSWQMLASEDIDTKKLLPAISFLITNGLLNPMDENWRKNCLEATSLYFNFLIIPGSYAFNIFHPNLFSKALASFKLGARLSVGSKKKPKNQSSRKTASMEPQDENDLVFENFEGGQPLSSDERRTLIRDLNCVIHNLHILMKEFPLTSEPDSLEHIIQRLVDVTRLEVNTSTFRFGCHSGYESAQTTIFSLAYNSYTLIGSLCQAFHGDVQYTVTIVTQYLLPSIMMLPASGTDPTPRELGIIKDHAVYFLQFLMLKLKGEASRGISILIQHLCTKVQDRSELRQKGSQVVVDLMRSLPMQAYSDLVFWIFKFAYHDKACHRLFALDVIAKLLYEVDRGGKNRSRDTVEDEQNSNEDMLDDSQGERATSPVAAGDGQACIVNENLQQDVPSHRFLLAVIIGRCCDSSGTVRTKALQTLAECTKTNNAGIRNLMEEIFVTPYADVDDIFQSEAVENEFLCYKRFIRLLRQGEDSHIDPLPGAKAVFRMLGERIQDDKVFVRKAALQVIENLMRFNRKCMTKDLLKTVFNFCRDPAVMVRKHMIRQLTDLVSQHPDHPLLPAMWVDNVLPRIVDPESTVQERVLECLEELIIKNLIVFNRMSAAIHRLPWSLLMRILRSDKRTYLYNACFSWEKSKVITDKTVNVIKTHVGTVNNVPAWILLAAIAEYIDFQDSYFVLQYYQQLATSDTNEIMLKGLVLETLKSLWLTIAPDHQEAVYRDLLQQLSAYQVGVQMIRPSLDLLLATPPFPGNRALALVSWAPAIVESAEPIWRGKMDLLCSGGATADEMTAFLQVLMTYGDVVQLCPRRMTSDAFGLLKRLWTDVPCNAAAEETSFRAGVVVVMGKLCIANEDFAKMAVAFFGQLLKKKCPINVKLNIVSIFYDMCIRCTSLVEPILGDVSLSLKDKDTMVREKTLVSLIQLLQEDYLKIRTDLFFHILGMLSDDVAGIQSMAKYYLTDCLLKKHPGFIHSHFIQSLFHYNNYQGHKEYSNVRLNDKEVEHFRLGVNQRRLVYRFMLDNMTDEQRFNLTHKLCIEILDGVSEGHVSLEGPGRPLIQDTFYVLSSEEIRLSSLRSRADDEPPVNEAEMATVILASTKKTIVSQLVKKNTIEHIVPIITTLKHKLEKQKSPLVTDLMVYLRDLMRDYKNEIKQIFSEDKQLASELLYDLKALEEREKTLKLQAEALKNRSMRGSESSEPDFESTSTTPVASPGRPVVPAEVRPVMAALTPQVRVNVEPLLAKVCQQVQYLARSSKSTTPVERPERITSLAVTAAELEQRLLDADISSERVLKRPAQIDAGPELSESIRLTRSDGSPVNLSRFNKLQLVVDKVPLTSPIRINTGTADGGRMGPPSGGGVGSNNILAVCSPRTPDGAARGSDAGGASPGRLSANGAADRPVTPVAVSSDAPADVRSDAPAAVLSDAPVAVLSDLPAGVLSDAPTVAKPTVPSPATRSVPVLEAGGKLPFAMSTPNRTLHPDLTFNNMSGIKKLPNDNENRKKRLLTELSELTPD